MSVLSHAVALAERGVVPDALVRAGIRRLLAARLAEVRAGGAEARRARQQALVETMCDGPIAAGPEAANRQHYELPASFFAAVLGPRLKYSCCLWPVGVDTLAAAEGAMLELTCARAGVADDMEVLDLGCGWGSLSLFVAERCPRGRVTAVSNSDTQGEFIRERVRERGLANLEVVTADLNDFAPARRFDRVLSVEMLEHMRNWEALLARIASWLAPEGRLFIHVFCHRDSAYLFEAAGEADWMARHFFTAGLMPSEDLLLHFQRDLVVERRWAIDGRHYARTLEAWLARLDAARERLLPVLTAVHGAAGARRALARWRMFFMACAESFAWGGGDEWLIAHALLAPR